MSEFLIALVAGIFFLSAIGKLTAPRAAQSFVGQIGVTPPFARAIVFSVALVELTASVLILGGWQLKAALTVAATLAVCFVFVQLAGLRAHTTSCRCFGKLDADLSPQVSLARAAALAVIAMTAMWRNHAVPVATSFGLERALASAFGAATFVVCFHLFDEVRKFRQSARASHQALVAESQEREAKHVIA